MDKNCRVNNNKKITDVFLISIYLNLIPVIIASQFVPGFRRSIQYNLMVGGVFIIQNILLFYQARKHSTKISHKTIVASIALVVIMITTLLIQSYKPISYFDKYDFINVSVYFIAFCSFLCAISCISITKKGVLNFLKGIVVIGVIASIYNLIINGNQILGLVYIRSAYAYKFQSFYLNKNTFAQLLYFSIIANTALLEEKKSSKGMFLFILFGFNLVATFSRTAISSVLIFLAVYFYKKYKKEIIGKLNILMGSVVACLVVWKHNTLRDFVVNTLIRNQIGVTHRNNLWTVAIKLLNEKNWMFGVGNFTAVKYLKQYGYSNTQFHSFYLDTLATGGVILLMFFIVILLFINKNIDTIRKNDIHIGIVYNAAFVSMLIYAIFESVSFFSMGYVGTLYTAFFISIPLMYSNNFIKSRNV